MIKDLLPNFLTLGLEEHFMTDYGDEAAYTLPWDLFDEESAKYSLTSARLCHSAAIKIVDQVNQWRTNENENKDENDNAENELGSQVKGSGKK